ncbi:single-minded homolog 2-like isoform X2 [Watersipora subatra]|uniref:single-minded homolog 2-like isoform X2 n=1 Tax=Watersipora subatra TaxID=2589382 RepID=UPI00355BEB0C
MAQVKKAEKSRVHAKQRRTEESREISEIAEQLPIAFNITKRLDKGSILRLALTYLRLKHLISTDGTSAEQTSINEADLMLDSFNGFFIIISARNEIVFVSENVERHMGLSQVDMLGRDIYEFVLEKDHRELKRQFIDRCEGETVTGIGLSPSGNAINMDINLSKPSEAPVFEHQRQFFLRMKCSYQRRSSGLKLNSSVTTSQNEFLLLQWTGYVHYEQNGRIAYLAAVARPLQPTPIMELKMDGNMFISRHSLDLYFMYCDPRLATMLGYEPDEISGSSMYQYHHPGDLEMCGQCHSNLMTAGTSISKYYRFLSKRNEWCWLQTRATIVYNTTKQPQYIVCMNYIVSEKEGRRYLLEYFDKSDTLSPSSSSSSGSSSRHSSSNHSPHSSASSENPSTPSLGLKKTRTQSNLSNHMTGLSLDGSQYSAATPIRSSTQMFEPSLTNSLAGSQENSSRAHQQYDSQRPLPSDSLTVQQQINLTSSQQNYSTSPVSYPYSANSSPSSHQLTASPSPSNPQYNASPDPSNQQYIASPAPSNQQYNVSPGPATQQYIVSPAPSSQHYNTSPTPCNQQYNVSPVPSSQQYNASPVSNERYSNTSSPSQVLYNTSPGQQCNASPPYQQQNQHPLESQYSPGHPSPASLDDSPAAVPQYPSPSHASEPSPTFYLPHQVKQDPEPSPNLIGGDLWLSVHSMVDPVIQNQQQRVSDSLIDEMEEISFQHCHSLMNETTQEAFAAFAAQDEPLLTGEDRNLRDWSSISQSADKDAMDMFHRVRKVLHGGSSRRVYSNHTPNRHMTAAPVSTAEVRPNVSVSAGAAPAFQSNPHSQSSMEVQPELQANQTTNIRHDSMEFNIALTLEANSHIASDLPLQEPEPLPIDSQQVTSSAELMLPPMNSLAMSRTSRQPSCMSCSSNISLDDLIRDSSQSLMSLSSNVSMSSLQPISALTADIDFNIPSAAFYTGSSDR